MDDKTEDAWPTTDSLERETLVAPAPPPPFEPAGPPPDRGMGAGMVLALVAIVLVALGVLIAWFLTHRGHDKPAVTTVVVSTAGTVTTNATTATTPKKANVSMPDVRGRSLAAARAALQAAGLKTTVTRATSAKPAGTVVDEAPKPGAKIAAGWR